MDLIKAIEYAMIDTGRMGHNWRLEVMGTREVMPGSDFVYVMCNVYKPRSRKPDYMWELFVDTARELLSWDQSTFTKFK